MNECLVFVSTLVSTRRRNKRICLIAFYIGVILRTGDELRSGIHISNQSRKERFIVNFSHIRSSETSIDTYVDFYTANAVKHGMNSFSVRSDFGSLQLTLKHFETDLCTASQQESESIDYDVVCDEEKKGVLHNLVEMPRQQI